MHALTLTVALAAMGCLVEPGDAKDKPPNPAESSLTALAGKYFYSNGFSGHRLTITPQGNFTLTYHMCTGEYHSYGRATLVDGHLMLRTYLVWRLSFPKAPKELIPIQWGKRLYLIPKDEGRAFCDYVNFCGPAPGWPPGPCYVRSGDDKKPAEGRPKVPKEWESMLLASPIEGKVVEVLGRSQARINLGYEDGAWKGMSLSSDCDGFRWLTTTAVHATNSVIESRNSETVFRVGARVSSRRYDLDRGESKRDDITRSSHVEPR